MIVAVLGTALRGEFEVEDICYPGLPPQHTLPRGTISLSLSLCFYASSFFLSLFLIFSAVPTHLPAQPVPAEIRSNSRYVALVSGLELGRDDARHPLALQLFVDFVCGQLGSPAMQAFAASVCITHVTHTLRTTPHTLQTYFNTLPCFNLVFFNLCFLFFFSPLILLIPICFHTSPLIPHLCFSLTSPYISLLRPVPLQIVRLICAGNLTRAPETSPEAVSLKAQPMVRKPPRVHAYILRILFHAHPRTYYARASTTLVTLISLYLCV